MTDSWTVHSSHIQRHQQTRHHLLKTYCLYIYSTLTLTVAQRAGVNMRELATSRPCAYVWTTGYNDTYCSTVTWHALMAIMTTMTSQTFRYFTIRTTASKINKCVQNAQASKKLHNNTIRLPCIGSTIWNRLHI